MSCITPTTPRPRGAQHVCGRSGRLPRAASIVALIAAVLVVLTGCGSNGASVNGKSVTTAAGRAAGFANSPVNAGGTPVRGGILRFARSIEPQSFTPWVGIDNGSIFAQQQVFDQLVEDAPDSPDPQPALADSWAISRSGLTYTFHLRPGVKFSDGAPVTAQDVKFSLAGFANPRIDSDWAHLAPVKSISIPDAAHVRVTLTKITPAFLNSLAVSGASIVPEKVVKAEGATKFGEHPIGTGPFLVAQWTRGQRLLLKRNPLYWRPTQPYLDGIEYTTLPDDNARMLAVRAGQVDVAEGVPFSQAAQVASAPGVTLANQKLYSTYWILFNERRAPLQDVAVRQALAYATPRAAIRHVVFHDLAPIANSASLPTKYWDPSIPPTPYDVAKAKELLAHSSVPHGFNLTVDTIGGDTVGKQLVTILQQSWGAIGVRLHVQQLDSGTWQTNLVKENYEATIGLPTSQTSDITLDDEFDQTLGLPAVADDYLTHWNNKQAAADVTAAGTTLDEGKRTAAFRRFQLLLAREVPIMGIVYPPNLFAVRSNVHDFVTVPLGWPLMRLAWLSR